VLRANNQGQGPLGALFGGRLCCGPAKTTAPTTAAATKRSGECLQRRRQAAAGGLGQCQKQAGCNKRRPKQTAAARPGRGQSCCATPSLPPPAQPLRRQQTTCETMRRPRRAVLRRQLLRRRLQLRTATIALAVAAAATGQVCFVRRALSRTRPLLKQFNLLHEKKKSRYQRSREAQDGRSRRGEALLSPAVDGPISRSGAWCCRSSRWRGGGGGARRLLLPPSCSRFSAMIPGRPGWLLGTRREAVDALGTSKALRADSPRTATSTEGRTWPKNLASFRSLPTLMEFAHGILRSCRTGFRGHAGVDRGRRLVAVSGLSASAGRGASAGTEPQPPEPPGPSSGDSPHRPIDSSPPTNRIVFFLCVGAFYYRDEGKNGSKGGRCGAAFGFGPPGASPAA